MSGMPCSFVINAKTFSVKAASLNPQRASSFKVFEILGAFHRAHNVYF